MFKLIFSPHEAIDECKKQKEYGKTWIKLIFGSVVLGVWAFVLAMLVLRLDITNSLMFLVGMIIISFVGNLFNAWIYKLVINTISGKGNFIQTLTALANGAVIMSVGLLIATLLWLIPVVGMILAMLLLIIAIVLSYSVMIRTLTVMTGADLLTIVVGLMLVLVSSLIASLLLNAMMIMSMGLTGLTATGI